MMLCPNIVMVKMKYNETITITSIVEILVLLKITIFAKSLKVLNNVENKISERK